MESANGLLKEGRLLFSLHKWAEGCPIAFEEGEDDDETIGRMEANALDRLVAAGEITDKDRDRVVFMTRIIVAPPKREDAGVSNVAGAA